MNVKPNPDDCGTLPCQSTLLYSLLLAGVTSTSTLCVLGADYFLDSNSAHAAPAAIVNANSVPEWPAQPVVLPSNHFTTPAVNAVSDQHWNQDFAALLDRTQPVSTQSNPPISDRHWNQNFAALVDQAGQQRDAELKASLVASEPASDARSEPDRQAATRVISPAVIPSDAALSVQKSTLLPSSFTPSAPYNFSRLHAADLGVTDLALNLDTASETQATQSEALAPSSENARATQLSETGSTTVQTGQTEQTEQRETDREIDRSHTSQSDGTNSQNNQSAGTLLGRPFIHLQGAYVLQGDESSARLRATGTYILNPNVMFGATVDLSTGNAFVEQDHDGINLDELYVTLSPTESSNLRFTIGWMDLTSYFDRNSFAKDVVTQFFNPVFQTNPALVASGITASRLGVLVNWDALDNLNFKAAAFSSDRDLGNFAIDAFAGEVGVRFGNLIVRGTYATDKDAGADSGFQEIFQFPRDGGRRYGLTPGDREESYGINAEYYIPELKLGLFGRYGHYENLALDRGGDTFSVGVNLLDLFLPDDRLGLGYGRNLSNDSLRRDQGNDVPDVLELFYDVRITPNLRAGATLQFRDQFSETIAGFRIRADFDVK